MLNEETHCQDKFDDLDSCLDYIEKKLNSIKLFYQLGITPERIIELTNICGSVLDNFNDFFPGGQD